MSKVAGDRVAANPNPPQAREPGTLEAATSQDKAAPSSSFMLGCCEGSIDAESGAVAIGGHGPEMISGVCTQA